MKVKELQQQLSKLDPDLEVLCYREYEDLQSNGQLFQLLDILDVSTVEGEKTRLNDETPYMKFGKSSNSVVIATLEVTPDF